MESITIQQDSENPDLFHITVQKRSFKILQAAARSYGRMVVASRKYYYKHAAKKPPSENEKKHEKNTFTLEVVRKLQEFPS
jgi:hypothetical protein